MARLGDLLRLRKDIVHPRDNPRGRSVFVGLEHIESHTGRRLGQEEVEMSRLTGRKPRFFKGDIVYGYLRPYLNKVWLAEFDGLCSVDQYVYEVNGDDVLPAFLAWFMRSPAYLENSAVGKAPGWLPRIRTHEVASVPIWLPPITTQRRIVNEIEERVAAWRRLMSAGQERLALLERYPAALLRRAFSGEL